MDGIGSVDRTRPVVGQTAAPVREGSAEAKDTQAQDKVAIQAGPPPSLESLRTEVRNALDKLDEVQSGFSRCGRALSKENEELNAAQDKVARLLRDGEYRRYDATEGYLSPRHGYDPYPGHHGPFPPGPFPPGHHDGSHEGDGSLEKDAPARGGMHQHGGREPRGRHQEHEVRK